MLFCRAYTGNRRATFVHSSCCVLFTCILGLTLPVALQAFSVNSENHTVKIGRSESDLQSDDVGQHAYEPVYEPLNSAEFGTLLMEITEFVHTWQREADEAAIDELLMIYTPVRLHEPCIRQAADTEGTRHVRRIKQHDQTSRYTGGSCLEIDEQTGNVSQDCRGELQ